MNTMPQLKREWYEITMEVIKNANEQINASLINPLHGELPAITVQEIADEYFKKMMEFGKLMTQISIYRSAPQTEMPESEMPVLEDALVPVFKGLFLRARLAKARELDQQRSRTINPQIIASLESKLNVYDTLIREPWFQACVPEYHPALDDLLTLERVEKLDMETQFRERQFDEKFHLLQSPTLLHQDLHYYRVKCGMRGISVAIAFVDIDKFKDFNTAVGQIHVDRYVLPVFMRALEAHIYGHGYGYRYGGEEYVLLMPNADAILAMAFVHSLQKRIEKLTFVGVNKTITISVGLCVADRDCHLTDEELLQKAERAMNFAKKEGRDRIAGYGGKLFDESELQVITPAVRTSP
jgi:diguanylate cyclase (GGDEF)-like protein